MECRDFGRVGRFYEPIRKRATEASAAGANGLDGEADAFYIRSAMKTIVSSLVLLGILTLSGASFVRAVGPTPSLSKGKVLILKNEYTMEGDIERVGDRYRVRRNVGETWVPADRVLALTASLPDAYVYLRGRINREDADERLRLARWCRANGLREQALGELQAAAALRPDHAETKRLLQHWKQAALRTATPIPAAPATPPSPAADPPPVEVTSESLGLFVTRVQPILMNTCANCHATGRGGKFRLTQVYEDSIGNRRTLEKNLAAVLAEVDLNQPEASRLLIKAVSDHAHTGRAPLRDRQIAPYRTLESWVKQTVANNPHLRDSLPASTTAPSALLLPSSEQRPLKGQEESEWGADARLPTGPRPSPGTGGENEGTALPSSAPMPPALGAAYGTLAERLRSEPRSDSTSKTGAVAPRVPSESRSDSTAKESSDPYDPELFNQKMHPEANQSGPGK
jgi:hypothetical protein